MLLEDFSSAMSRIDENVTAVYERIQGKSTAKVLGLLPQINQLSSETERIAILEWFSVIPYQGHHDLASENRVADTGQWLFQRKEFRHWQQSKESTILWLHGIRKS